MGRNGAGRTQPRAEGGEMIHPYWPLTPGTHIDYQVFEIEGVADRNAGVVQGTQYYGYKVG